MQIETATPDDLPSLLDLYQKPHPSDPVLVTDDAAVIWERYRLHTDSEVFIGSSAARSSPHAPRSLFPT